MRIRLSGCVLLDRDGKIGLLHRNTNRFQHWELPGGKVEENETNEVAAQRELKEELGIDITVNRYLGSSKFSDADGHFEYIWFRGKIDSGVPTVCEPKTFDDFRYFSLLELDDLTLSANMTKLLGQIKSNEVQLFGE